MILGRIPLFPRAGSEPIEPIIIGPGGTFGQDPLQKAPPRAIVKPVVPDAVETAAEDFFAPAGSHAPAPVVNPTVPPAAPEAPAAAPTEPEQPEMPVFQTPTLPTTDEPVVPVRVSAENAVAMRSEPDEDGWISITSEPVEEKDINTLVAAAMEKPAVGEQQAAIAPAEEPEAEESYQYQYPGIDLFEKAPEESDPNAQDELKANAQSSWTRWKVSASAPVCWTSPAARRSRGMKSSPWRASRSAASPRWQTTSH